MGKTRTRRPASHPRSARRSLVELTAAASRAIDDGLHLPSGGISAFPDDPAQSQHRAETSDHIIVAKQGTAPSPIAGSEFVNPAVPPNGERVDSNSTAEMMVNIAKDYQNKALESIKVGLNAALDHTKDFAETRAGNDAASKDRGGSSSESNFLTILKGAATELRAEALELMKANMVTNLEYARALAGTTTMAEFVGLSSAQARKQCELVLRQAGALKSFAQTITKSGAD